MANTNKKSINTYFSELINRVVETHPNLSEAEKTDYKDFLAKRIEVNSKKNSSGGGKPTKTQEENAGYKTAILAEMENGKAYTITDMCKELPTCVELDKPNKINALVKQLKDEGKVVRTEIKGRAYFTKVENEVEGD